MENTRMYADSLTAVPSPAPLPTDEPTPSAPTPTTAAPTAAAPASSRRRLLWHLGEMALAMVAGMLLLGPLWELAGAALGVGDALARPEVAALVMATNMTVGMTVGMRYRAHGWHAVGEMAAAMYVPFLLLLVPFRAGLIDADALMLGGHLLMIPAMVLVAVRHRHEAPAPVRRHRVVVALAHRWPTGLALLLTVGHVGRPERAQPVDDAGAGRRLSGDRRGPSHAARAGACSPPNWPVWSSGSP